MADVRVKSRCALHKSVIAHALLRDTTEGSLQGLLGGHGLLQGSQSSICCMLCYSWNAAVLGSC